MGMYFMRRKNGDYVLVVYDTRSKVESVSEWM